MSRIKIIVIVAVLAFAASGGWRVGSYEVGNIELQEDMHDLVSQSRNYIRYTPTPSDDALRDTVIRLAKGHHIQLEPSQVTVQHTGSDSTTYLAADYTVPVNLPGFSFNLHFTPSSTKNTF